MSQTAAEPNRIETAYRRLKAEGRDVLKLFSGNPNEEGFVFPPAVLEEAYLRYFREQTYRPESKGLRKAREAVSRYYEGQGASIDPEHVLLTAGSSESFFYLFSLLARAGDNILAPNPAYPLFDYIAGLTGIELRHYPLREERGWTIDLDAVRGLADPKTRAIVLVSPNNPTGAVASEDEIRGLVDWANARGLPLICDEVFCEFFYGKGRFPRPIVAAKPDLCFTLNGISKMFALPALKLGWIAVTGKKARVEAAVDRLETTADTFLSCHTPVQEALPEIFEKGKSFAESYVAQVGRRRRMAVELLSGSPDVRFASPAGGFYLMAEVVKETAGDEEDFVIALLEDTGVFVHPGYFFDYEKGLHIVLSHLPSEDRLRKGISSLLDFLASL